VSIGTSVQSGKGIELTIMIIIPHCRPTLGSCPAPAGSQPSGYTIVRSIRTVALRLGVTKSFRAYLPSSPANGSTVPALALRSELQSSGVSLTDAAGGKDVADKMLLGSSSLATLGIQPLKHSVHS
jgi:hypothetical protein